MKSKSSPKGRPTKGRRPSSRDNNKRSSDDRDRGEAGGSNYGKKPGGRSLRTQDDERDNPRSGRNQTRRSAPEKKQEVILDPPAEPTEVRRHRPLPGEPLPRRTDAEIREDPKRDFVPPPSRPGQKPPLKGPKQQTYTVEDAAVPCGIKSICQTCRYVNIPYKSGLEEKYEKGLNVLRDSGVLGRAKPIGVQPSLHELHYRCIAKLAVRPIGQAVRDLGPNVMRFPAEGTKPASLGPRRFAIGLFQPQSHKVVDIDECPLHAHPIRGVLPILREQLEAADGLQPYNEETHEGDLRYVIIRTAHLTNEMGIIFVCTSANHKSALKKVVANIRARNFKLSSAWISVNEEKTNAIWGKQTIQIFGTSGLRESVCGLKFEVGPQSFFQVNPWQAEAVYRRIVSLVGPKVGQGVAWDLYSGVGQISLNLARSGYRVFAVEEVAQATTDATRNALRNGMQKAVIFATGRSEDVLNAAPSWAAKPDVIVANPSRRGMDDSVVRAVATKLHDNTASRFFYMSCDVTTLARDLKVFKDLGIKLRQVEAFDMFPQTAEMEWLTVLSV